MLQDLFFYENCHPYFWVQDIQYQGGHKPGKHEKPGKPREFEELSKTQGKLREI